MLTLIFSYIKTKDVYNRLPNGLFILFGVLDYYILMIVGIGYGANNA